MSSERTEIATVRISAGRRTYFFDVKESSDDNRYLVISESTRTGDNFKHEQVMVFEEHVVAFAKAFGNVMTHFEQDQKVAREKGTDKAYSVDEIRQEHPNAYRKWTKQEDDQLHSLYASGETVKNLAAHFGRKPGAIRSRLRKLGLDRPPYG